MAEQRGPFAEATAVTPHPGSAAGTFDAEIRAGWDILGNANGGYLAALAARACVHALARPDPVSVTAHYLSPGTPGPVRVDVAPQRVGHRFATATARVADAEDRPLLSVLGSFADLAEPAGPLRVDASPPELPPVEDCLGAPPPAAGPSSPATAPSFMDKVDLRLHPDDAGFRSGAPSGHPRVRGWFRFPGDEPVGTIGLLCVLDAFPPTVFNADLPIAWVPTLEFTAHVRCRPAPGWLACEFTTRIVSNGFLEEDGLVWDSEGQMVAQSRQLALVPRD